MNSDEIRDFEWMEQKQANPYVQAKTDKQVKLDNGLTVTKSGKVYKGKNICKVGNCIGDGDLDMVVPIEPFVEYDEKIPKWKRTVRKRKRMDDLMDEAGYVNGNKKQFRNPVILHKDNDWMNFDSGNLEWTDKSDPRYKEYHNRKVDDKNALGRKWNGEEKWSYMEKQEQFQHI